MLGREVIRIHRLLVTTQYRTSHRLVFAVASISVACAAVFLRWESSKGVKLRLCADRILRVLFSREFEPWTTGFSQGSAPPLVPLVVVLHKLRRCHSWAVLRLPCLLKLSCRLRGAVVPVFKSPRILKTAVLGPRVTSLHYNHARTFMQQETGEDLPRIVE